MMDMYRYAKQLEHDKKFEQALKWLYKFLELKEQHNMTKRESAIKDIGAVLHKLGRTKEAIAFLKEQRYDIKKVGPYLQFISNLMFQMLPRPDDLYPRIVWVKPYPYSFYFQGEDSVQTLRDFIFAIFPSYQSKIGDVNLFVKDKSNRHDIRVSVTFHTHSSAVKAVMKYMQHREVLSGVEAITWENDKEMNLDFNRKPNSRAKKNQMRAENVTSSFVPRQQTDPTVQHIEKEITEIVLSMQQDAHRKQAAAQTPNWYFRGRNQHARNFHAESMDEEGREEQLVARRALHCNGDTIAMQLCPQKQKNSTIHIPLVPLLREQLSYLLQLGMTLDAPPAQTRHDYTKTRQVDDDQGGLDVQSLCTIAPPPGLGSPMSRPCSSPMEPTEPQDPHESNENADPMTSASSSQDQVLPSHVLELMRNSLKSARLDSAFYRKWMQQCEQMFATSQIIPAEQAEKADQDNSEPALLLREARRNKFAAFVEIELAKAEGRVNAGDGFDRVPNVHALLAAALDLNAGHEEWSQDVDGAQEMLRQTVQLKVWKETREQDILADQKKRAEQEAQVKSRQETKIQKGKEPQQQPRMRRETSARMKLQINPQQQEKVQRQEQNEESASSSAEPRELEPKKQSAQLNVDAPEFVPNIPSQPPVADVHPFEFSPCAQEFVPSSSSLQELGPSAMSQAPPTPVHPSFFSLPLW